ncbi:unnamed protein product, partial [Mesorhabditis spiculigera]
MRNQAYLAELAKHQHELTSYSAKQMEYLDQQRRYQQAVIDHQAQAALLMQQQQQKLINEQLGHAKVMYAKQRKAMASKTHKEPERNHKLGDKTLTTDEDLREYFRREYGMDMPKDGELTDDERETLRQLKVELVQKRMGGGGGGGGRGAGARAEADDGSPQEHGVCSLCQSVNFRKLTGGWTEMYGDAKAIKHTFRTINALNQKTRGRKGTSKPACIGIEVGKAGGSSAEANYFYRESGGQGNALREMRGEIRKTEELEAGLSLETQYYSADYCVIAADSGSWPEYILMAETKGSNACRTVHVFARSASTFKKSNFNTVSKLLKKLISKYGIHPLAPLPHPELCELTTP